ncbi:hypothetical protein M426DRAFT_10353 [Hypoxylon sp. CI-4A]|nr:hypothetical protein M426DRAFT_10353 [Hypoxylon sp. CI-4A]
MYTVRPIAKQDNRVVGSDFAGEVVQIGNGLLNIDGPRVQIGARVSGFVQGACSTNERPGAFADYVVTDYDLTWGIPRQMSWEEAATISCCGVAAARGVWERLQLPCPFYPTIGFDGLEAHVEEHVDVFIHGASSSLGLFAAQLVRLSEQCCNRKIRLFGTASATKHSMLSAAPYSYEFLVDYYNQDWQETISAEVPGGVHYAIDTISIGQTVEQTDSIIRDGGRLATFRSPAAGNYDAHKLKHSPVFGAVWEALGVEIGYHGFVLPANAKARAFAAAFYEYLGSDSKTGGVKLVPNPVRIMPGGLEQIPLDGFTLLGGNLDPERHQDQSSDHMRPISAGKIVYRLQ